MSVKDTDLLSNGVIPEQWKPENQDPSVAYTVDEMTGIRTPLVAEEAPKKKGKKAVEPEQPVEPELEPALEDLTVAELKAEINLQNEARDEDDQIVPDGTKKADLVEALAEAEAE